MLSKRATKSSLIRQGTIVATLVALLCVSSPAVKSQNIESPPEVDLSRHLAVYVSVIDPKIVQDVFGKRVAQQFVAIQVTISNKNPNYQFLIHDVSLDLREVFGSAYVRSIQEYEQRECEAQCQSEIRLCERRNANKRKKEDCRCRNDCLEPYRINKFEISSLELSLIRGVAERGQGEDKRNKTLRYFRAIGTIAAGLIGVASFGPSYPKSVAIFNGPVINSTSELYPDYTINQMNRLSDSAYKSNTVVPKQQSKVIVAFIPQGEFLTKKQRKVFWEDPTELYPKYGAAVPAAPTNEAPYVDFRRTKALVDGSLITEIRNLGPSVTGVQIDDDQARNFLDPQPVVEGYVLGRFLEGTQIDLVHPPAGTTIALKGTPEENKIHFVIKSDTPVPTGTDLTIRVFDSQGSQNIEKTVSFNTPGPTLNDPEPREGNRGTASLPVTLKGKNFIVGVTTVQPPTGVGVHLLDQTVESDTEIKITLEIDASADDVVRLRVMNGTVPSNEVRFRTKEPQ